MSTRQRTGVPRVFSFGPPPSARPPSKYPHRRTIRWWNVVTTTANYCLLLFTLFVLLVGLVDIGHSFIYSNRASKVADLSITFGTYAGVVSPLPRFLQPLRGPSLTPPLPPRRSSSASSSSSRAPSPTSAPSSPSPRATSRQSRPTSQRCVPLVSSALVPFLPASTRADSPRPPPRAESERAHPERVRARVHHHQGGAAERAQPGRVGSTRCVGGPASVSARARLSMRVLTLGMRVRHRYELRGRQLPLGDPRDGSGLAYVPSRSPARSWQD